MKVKNKVLVGVKLRINPPAWLPLSERLRRLLSLGVGRWRDWLPVPQKQ